jgi:hypothetical protein
MHMICTLLPKIEAARAKPDSMIVGGRGRNTPVAETWRACWPTGAKRRCRAGPRDINSLRRS